MCPVPIPLPFIPLRAYNRGARVWWQRNGLDHPPFIHTAPFQRDVPIHAR
ncbi:hypothetical protein SAMN05428936_101864 [Pelagibacterium halotolerans]|nr:hypothetical protein SAMN05428936_101864 [Pelagibacterium halotolerans]